MNDEIKEILDRLDVEEFELPEYASPIAWTEMFKIRDYITNLQNEKEDYKSRCEKTIEYIKSNYIDNPIEFKKDLLKILGGDE